VPPLLILNPLVDSQTGQGNRPRDPSGLKSLRGWRSLKR